ncbi:MAG: T9SS type A sorting domain-containing protein, partial [Candidatus Methylacidiphilales bacterium]
YVFTSGVPTTEPAIPTLRAPAADMTNTSATDLAVVNAVAIRQHAGGIVGTIDGIRVSNTWGDGPLPVKLSSFEANVNDEITLLSWSTSSEINNKGFEIERSMDGKDFETIGFVKGNGNSNVLNVYSFKFESNESAFYRLKQIDFDGVYDYSKIVFVSNENSDDKSEFLPNPFVNEISIVNNERITKAEIMDITGKLVLSEEILNLNKASINTMSLKPGMYYLKIYTANSTETKRVIKNN